MEFVKTGYKSHKIIRLYAKVGIIGNCGANRREFEDQSAIKGNLGQKNAFFCGQTRPYEE